MMNLHLKVI